jgi:outer membrane protein
MSGHPVSKLNSSSFGNASQEFLCPKTMISEGVIMRRIKIILASNILISVFLVMTSYGADVAKIGVIDMQRVLETSSAGKAALAEIKKQKEVMETELQKKKEEIEQLRKQLERDAMVISREKREEKEREGRIKLNDFKTMQKKYVAELKEQEKRHLLRMRKEIFDIIQKIGKKEGYLLIVNNVSVLYSPTSIDITDQLIKDYNAKYAQRQGEAVKKSKK